jgi:hypothetical protein
MFARTQARKKPHEEENFSHAVKNACGWMA